MAALLMHYASEQNAAPIEYRADERQQRAGQGAFGEASEAYIDEDAGFGAVRSPYAAHGFV